MPSRPTSCTVLRFCRGAYASTTPASAPARMPPISISQPKLLNPTSTLYNMSSTNRPMSARTSSRCLYLKIEFAASRPMAAAEAAYPAPDSGPNTNSSVVPPRPAAK